MTHLVVRIFCKGLAQCWLLVSFLINIFLVIISDCVRVFHLNFLFLLQEKSFVLSSLAEKAKLVADGFNSVEGVTCNTVMGAMYSFPQIHLPKKAIEAAKVSIRTSVQTSCPFQIVFTLGSRWAPGYPQFIVGRVSKKFY